MSQIVAAKAAQKAKPMIEEIKPYILPAVGITVLAGVGVGSYILYKKFIGPITEIPDKIAGIPDWLKDLVGEVPGVVGPFGDLDPIAVIKTLNEAWEVSLAQCDITIFDNAQAEVASSIAPWYEKIPLLSLIPTKASTRRKELEAALQAKRLRAECPDQIQTIIEAEEIADQEKLLLQDQISDLHNQIDANQQWYEEQLAAEQERLRQATKAAQDKYDHYEQLLSGQLQPRPTGFEPPDDEPYVSPTITWSDITSLSWKDFRTRYIVNAGRLDDWHHFKASEGVHQDTIAPEWLKIKAYRLYFEERKL